jgi:hypothetical protein
LPSRTAVAPGPRDDGVAVDQEPAVAGRVEGDDLHDVAFDLDVAMPDAVALLLEQHDAEVETCTVSVISWFGFTSENDRRPISAPLVVKTSVKPPSGRPRSVKDPSPATVVVMEEFSSTVTVTVAALAAPALAARSVPVPARRRGRRRPGIGPMDFHRRR